MKKGKKFLFTITCVLMAFIMCFFTACSKQDPAVWNDGNNPSVQEPVVPDDNDKPSKQDPDVSTGDNKENQDSEDPAVTPVIPDESTKDLFEEYELDDVESFVCSLLYTDLRQEYDTFTGYVTLPDSTESYGLCYTDYEEGYFDSNGKTYFSSGFIAFSDAPSITKEAVNSGLEIHSLEDEDDDFSYLLSYSTEDVHGHGVVYNKYYTYDIINGELSYSEQDYEENMTVDVSRGNIYNYDTSEWDYLVEEIDYVPVTGISLVGETDYQKIVDEVNAILAKQEANLSFSELESYVEQSQEALISYLLGLQEETFMDISTDQLVEIAKDLEPLQHIQIVVDAEGNTTLKIIEIQKLPTLWEKILTSYICACSVVLGTVCNIVGKAVPGLSALGGTLVGVGMEVFSQVVISNTPVSDIQWAQVGVAAAAGCISGLINCKLNTSKFFNKSVSRVFFREVTDTLCDGLVGGTEFFANSLIAGQSFQEACKNFGYGVVAGVVISGGVKVATATVKGGAKLVKKAFGNSVSEIGGQPVTKISSEIAEDSVGDLNEKVASKSLKESTENVINLQLFASDTDDALTKIGKYTDDVLDDVSDRLTNGNKILNGKAKGNTFKGGHSAKVSNSPDFSYGRKIPNPDGTISYTDVSYKLDGKTVTKKFHTAFPSNWDDVKISKSINYIAENCPAGSADAYGNRIFIAYIDNVQIVVIKDISGIITAGYPTGGNLTENLIKQFSINL